MSDDLVAWLKACVDEDEQMAQAASPGPWKPNAEHDEVLACDDITVADGFALSNNQLRATVDHIARHDPVRVLAEVGAKRRIIDEHDLQVKEYPARFDSLSGERIGPKYEVTCGVCGWASMDPTSGCETLRLLASVYAGRPGWRSEWAPDEEENHD